MPGLPLSRARLVEIWRYYQAGLLNAGFGFGAYSLLVWLGLNMFVAQIISHVAGTLFNYLTYSRHVFRDAPPAKLRFGISYVGNYLLGLGTLAATSRVFVSPYVAGFAALVAVSVLNYFVLKHLVFRKAAA